MLEFASSPQRAHPFGAYTNSSIIVDNVDEAMAEWGNLRASALGIYNVIYCLYVSSSLDLPELTYVFQKENLMQRSAFLSVVLLAVMSSSTLLAQSQTTQKITKVSTNPGDSTAENIRQRFNVEWADIPVDNKKDFATHLVKVCVGWVLKADRRVGDSSYTVKHQDGPDKITDKCIEDNLKSRIVVLEAEHLKPGSDYLYQVHLGFRYDAQNADDGFPIEWRRSEIQTFTSPAAKK
ncbi:hypothetical protein ACCAA_610001 [Candidatus Accumulibacter aalborgensis]|uniref:Uncharacterized protein n=1 Tax=Candidatus Accumulibacter aalborgensis TaxID=1860102 RepID=A0A1A8XVF6_9PROT|nr:hypothetical protein ACCAA_610001 [Candidatus Accumulibacter aalborgensis]